MYVKFLGEIMQYYINTVPLNTDVWCVGFKFGRNKITVNRPPVLGKVNNRNWNARFVPNDKREVFLLVIICIMIITMRL